MAKASLKKVTEKWVEGKAKNDNGPKQKELPNKTITTFNLSNKVRRILMYNKADTGETMSETVERLVLKNFKHD